MSSGMVRKRCQRAVEVAWSKPTYSYVSRLSNCAGISTLSMTRCVYVAEKDPDETVDDELDEGVRDDGGDIKEDEILRFLFRMLESSPCASKKSAVVGLTTGPETCVIAAMLSD